MLLTACAQPTEFTLLLRVAEELTLIEVIQTVDDVGECVAQVVQLLPIE